MKTGKLVNFEDWRWSLLMCVAMLLIVLGLQKRQGGMAEASRSVSMTPESWLEMDLRWEQEGRLGQGIYFRGSKGARLATMVEEEDFVEEKLVEPRLAVFIARPLDLNRIDFDTLRVLKGVGPKMAAAIIAYRQDHGPFRRIEDLLEVKGVGPGKFKLLCRDLALHVPDNF